jgi:hypothetical protein
MKASNLIKEAISGAFKLKIKSNIIVPERP